jgi:hypothetical protein
MTLSPVAGSLYYTYYVIVTCGLIRLPPVTAPGSPPPAHPALLIRITHIIDYGLASACSPLSQLRAADAHAGHPPGAAGYPVIGASRKAAPMVITADSKGHHREDPDHRTGNHQCDRGEDVHFDHVNHSCDC